MSVINITKENFEQEILNSKKPVLVDFWASWCMPCKMMLPVVDEIAEEVKDNAKVAKINVDEERELAMQFGVSSIPTFMSFEAGEVKNKAVGRQAKEDLLEMLEIE